MSEPSTIEKIMQALELSKSVEISVCFTSFEAIELLEHIKNLEEECGLLHHDAHLFGVTRVYSSTAQEKE